MNTANTTKSFIPYFLMGSAVLGVLFLGSATLFIRAAMENTTTSTNSIAIVEEGIVEEPVVAPVNIDDPFITAIPDEHVSEESKSTVFVSSLDPIKGSSSSKVYVIVYGDFTDSVVKDYLGLIDTLAQEYSSEDVAFVWKDYVAEDNEVGRLMAEIAHCANEYNVFWPYADKLVNQTANDEASLIELATEVGLQTASAEECLDDRGYAAQVIQSYSAGTGYGVTNGHTVFINNRKFDDLLTEDELKQNIDEVLATY